jgi:hypothetical protein
LRSVASAVHVFVLTSSTMSAKSVVARARCPAPSVIGHRPLTVTGLLLDLSLAKLVLTLLDSVLGAPFRTSARWAATSWHLVQALKRFVLRLIGFMAAPPRSRVLRQLVAGVELRRWHLATGAAAWARGLGLVPGGCSRKNARTYGGFGREVPTYLSALRLAHLQPEVYEAPTMAAVGPVRRHSPYFAGKPNCPFRLVTCPPLAAAGLLTASAVAVLARFLRDLKDEVVQQKRLLHWKMSGSRRAGWAVGAAALCFGVYSSTHMSLHPVWWVPALEYPPSPSSISPPPTFR